MNAHPALVIIDVQNDFCPGGALAVPDGDKVVAPLSRLATRFGQKELSLFASRDWHPLHTAHFAPQGGPWPVHCVQESHGAAFHPALHLPPQCVILSKGVDPQADGYSAFEGQNNQQENLDSLLKKHAVKHVYIGGLATDYCVKATVLDALQRGYGVTVLTDAVAGVNLAPDDAQKALAEMQAEGALLATTEEILATIETIE